MFRTRSLLLSTFPMLIAVALVTPRSALAQDHTGGTFEIVVGGYFPQDDALDNEPIYGLRGGYRYSSKWAFEGSAVRYSTQPVPAIDLDLTLVDASVKWYPTGGAFLVFAGPGWAFAEAKLAGFLSVTDDSFTAHLGLGAEIPLSRRLYLRTDGRARWFETSRDIDLEGSLALGFRF